MRKFLLTVLGIAASGMLEGSGGARLHAEDAPPSTELTDAEHQMISEMEEATEQMSSDSVFAPGESKVQELMKKARQTSKNRKVQAVADAMELVLSQKKEERMGLKVRKTIGVWKARAGTLQYAAAKAFGAEPKDFAFATVTVAGGWTLGMKWYCPKDEETYVREFYLQGPKPFPAGQPTQYSIEQNGVFFPQMVTVNSDGTIPIQQIPNALKTLKLKVPGGRVDIPITGKVEALRWMMNPDQRQPVKKEKPEPKLTPPPR